MNIELICFGLAIAGFLVALWALFASIRDGAGSLPRRRRMWK